MQDTLPDMTSAIALNTVSPWYLMWQEKCHVWTNFISVLYVFQIFRRILHVIGTQNQKRKRLKLAIQRNNKHVPRNSDRNPRKSIFKLKSHTLDGWWYFQQAIYEEQQQVYGDDTKPLSYDGFNDMPTLDRCLKETLRLRPPISTMIRMVRTEQVC